MTHDVQTASTSVPTPGRLALAAELAAGELSSILLWHTTDRWYLGDFLRHASWLTCLSAAGPGRLDLATHPSYLPLFSTDHRVSGLLDVAGVGGADLAGYDLVVVPGTFRPERFDPVIARGLYAWNDGWAYVRHGVVVASGDKTDLNYFSAASHQHGETALPTATAVSLAFPAAEVGEVARAVRQTFGTARPVIVYNPTASNPVTRRTTITKEVENVLDLADHAALLGAVRTRLPEYDVLVGSALVPGDEQNRSRIEALAATFRSDPGVRTIFDVGGVPDLTTLRGFSTLLAGEAVTAMLGTSTGTNTHLAALVDLPAFSVERGADDGMIANWRRADELPMGSIRWRNPSPLVGAVNLDWERKTLADLTDVADAFVAHLGVHVDGPHTALRSDAQDAAALAGVFLARLDDAPPAEFVAAGLEVLALVRPDLRDWYGDFADELAYLRLRPGFAAVTALADLPGLPPTLLERESVTLRGLIRDSMLHKLAHLVVHSR